MGPSEHLTWNELHCKDGIVYPLEFVKDGRVFRLAQVFENIRTLCGGGAIHILSAYRTPEYNAKVGGVRNSQHIEGRALDLRHSKMNNTSFHRIILQNAMIMGVRGIGYYPNFVHIDIRPSDRLIMWDS